MNKNPKSNFLSFFLWGFFFYIALSLLVGVKKDNTIQFDQFLNDVKENRIESVVFTGNSITGQYRGEGDIKGKSFKSYGNVNNEVYLKILLDNNLVPTYEPEKASFLSLLGMFLPIILFIIFLFIIMKGSKGGGMNLLSFSKARFKMASPNDEKVKFTDVAGIDECKEDLTEIVDFLKSPTKYTKMGAKLPKGVILAGPPGTGKTLLAKAVAGEADVPFFSMSGSDFVEMFVGVGASRVRDLFAQARERAPCIVFIDEIDAVGKSRSSNGAMQNDERDQTLNQLLTEMDGFGPELGIIVLAATNRLDVLDPALTRSGRFDRRVIVPLPDIKGREEILKIHAKKAPLSKDINWKRISQGTAGFSGADLANLINEATLLAGKRNLTEVGNSELENARDKIIMGNERRSLVISDKEKEITAYHESGHAIVSLALDLDPVHKISIVPRGMALGVTITIPEENQLSLSKEKAIKKIAMMMGGRAAEELIYNHFTTGAGNDIERATHLSRKMVNEWGMSSLGPINFLPESGLTKYSLFSEKTKEKIDEEVVGFVNQGYNLAIKVLKRNRLLLDTMTKELVEKENLDENDVKKILENSQLEKGEG